eukprot:1641970-Rhodomonas_salina.1
MSGQWPLTGKTGTMQRATATLNGTGNVLGAGDTATVVLIKDLGKELKVPKIRLGDYGDRARRRSNHPTA